MDAFRRARRAVDVALSRPVAAARLALEEARGCFATAARATKVARSVAAAVCAAATAAVAPLGLVLAEGA